MKRLIKLSVIIITFLPFLAHAATFDIKVDTRGENINAIEGEVIISGGHIDRINTGDSSIVIWIKSPTYKDGKITFAGITPGGITGQNNLFSIMGDLDTADVKPGSILAVKGDGSGGEAKVTIYTETGKSVISDNIPPQAFVVNISKSNALFDGHYFAAYAAQDKESGIDHYEVQEKLWGKPADSQWLRSDSPYEIKDKLAINKLFVRALDKSGNSTVMSTSLPNRQIFFFILGIIVVILCVLYVRRL